MSNNQFSNPRVYDGVSASCSLCKEIKPLDMFHKDAGSACGRTFYCKECANRKSRENHAKRFKEDPDYRFKKRMSHLQSKWGISQEEYFQRIKNQNNQCAICRIQFSELRHGANLDHNHKTGKHREFLCNPCNQALGYAKESPHLLREMALYLEKHSDNLCREEGISP